MRGTPKILLSDCFLLFPKVQKSEMKSTRSKSVAKSIGKNFNGIKKKCVKISFFSSLESLIVRLENSCQKQFLEKCFQTESETVLQCQFKATVITFAELK